MSSSTRLYERLGEIPQDPEDPESLDDLVVCAFGAFERYYVCWKTRGGEHRQDGYDLPTSLKDWLFPIDGTTRDFASLQVVFGRGDEYFASDKYGKLEVKEPEIKKSTFTEGDELSEKPKLRRSRTISFLRPLSDPIAKFTTPPTNDVFKREDPAPRSQSVSSQPRPSLWTPAVSASKAPMVPKINTVVSTHIKEVPIASPISTPTRAQRRSRPSSISFNSGSFPKIIEGRQLVSRGDTPSEEQDPAHCMCVRQASKSNSLHISTSTFVSTEPIAMISSAIALTIQSEPVTAPLSTSSKSTISSVHIKPIPPSILKSSKSTISGVHIDPNSLEPLKSEPIPSITSRNSEYANLSTQTDSMVPAVPMRKNYSTSSVQTSPITLPTLTNSTTANSSTQTNPMAPFSPSRTALRVSTATESDTLSLLYSEASSALDVQIPLTENLSAPNPVYMGRMMDYFSKPGYQLGDSLFSSYRYQQQPVYQEDDGDGGEWGISFAERRQTV